MFLQNCLPEYGTNPIPDFHYEMAKGALTLLAPNSHYSGLSNEILHDLIPQGVLELQAVKLKTSRFFTIYLTKTNFKNLQRETTPLWKF